MIVKIPNEKFTQTSLSVSEGEVPVILQCGASALSEAIKKAENNAWIAGVEFIGTWNEIPTDITENNVNIYTIIPIEGIMGEEQLSEIIQVYPRWMNVVLRTADTFSNMQIVKAICTKFPNVRFTGGHFIALAGCKFGEVPKLRYGTHKKAQFVLRGMCSIDTIETEDNVVYTLGDIPCKNGGKKKAQRSEKDKKVKKATKPKEKKTLSFANASGLNAF